MVSLPNAMQESVGGMYFLQKVDTTMESIPGLKCPLQRLEQLPGILSLKQHSMRFFPLVIQEAMAGNSFSHSLAFPNLIPSIT